MAWTIPKTWTAIVVTVADLNTHIRDNLNILKASLDNNGHLSYASIVSKTANYTVTATDDIVLCTSGTFTITLPAASGKKHPVTVINNGTGVITIARTGADTIGLATSQTLGAASASAQGDSMTFVPDNVSNWNIV